MLTQFRIALFITAKSRKNHQTKGKPNGPQTYNGTLLNTIG